MDIMEFLKLVLTASFLALFVIGFIWLSAFLVNKIGDIADKIFFRLLKRQRKKSKGGVMK